MKNQSKLLIGASVLLMFILVAVITVHADNISANNSSGGSGGGGILSNNTSGSGGGGSASNSFSISPSSGPLGTEVKYVVGNAAGTYLYEIYFNGNLVASQLPSNGYVIGSFKVTKDIGAVAGDNKIILKWSGNGEIRGTTYFTLTESSGGGEILPIITKPVYPPSYFKFSVSTDKYYYAIGEQVKISATLSGNGDLGNAVVTAYVYQYTPCEKGDTCPAILRVRSNPITLQLIGAVAPACEAHEGITTCPTTQSYYYVGYYAPTSTGTYAVDASANVNGISQSDSTKFQVYGNGQNTGDNVDLSISPEEQKTVIGEPVTYILTVKDKHTEPECLHSNPRCAIASRAYTYNLEVFGLQYPFAFGQSSVTLGAGQSTDVKLTVYPSSTVIAQQQTAAVTAPQAATTAKVTAPVSVQTTTAVTGHLIATEERSTVAVQQTASAPVEKPHAESARIASDNKGRDNTYLNSVRFTVKATQSDDPTNADKANAVLRVYYYENPKPIPPPLPSGEEVTIEIYKGWNLINLPGDNINTDSDCRGDIAAFIYVNGKYLTAEQAQRALGDEFKTYVATHSFWVYSKEDCKVKITVENFATYSGLKLSAGWSFLGTTKDMVGETLNQIKGSCSFEKAYTWDAEAKSWSKLSQDTLITEPYNGIIVKASADCALGTNAIVPPPLPQ